MSKNGRAQQADKLSKTFFIVGTSTRTFVVFCESCATVGDSGLVYNE